MAVVKKVRKLGVGTGASTSARETSPLRPLYVLKTPPCSTGCPNQTDVRGIITTIAQAENKGKSYDQAFREAFGIVTEKNPLPAVCGRVCPHLCEDQCNREHVDGPVSINCIERAIGDFALENKLELKRLTDERQSEKVAVIGSGPAGLSCAYQLARRGYSVTVFESFPKAGGMLRYGIPKYRLPHAVLDAEIDRLLALGVELRLNTMVGKDISLDEVRQSHQAIFVGIGAHKGARLGVAGEDSSNVLTGAEFLHRVNTGERIEVGGNVIVIGGGDTAIDAARVSKRLGANVTIVYRRTIAEMPAIKHEIEDAEHEGIKIEFLAAPVAIVAENGRASGMTCLRMELGEPDASGRRRPVPIKGSEFFVPASFIIPAISQEPIWTGLDSLKGPKGWIPVDERGETAVANTFAGGDILELGIVTTAIYHGRRAAETIHHRLRGIPFVDEVPPPPIAHNKMKLDFYQRIARAQASAVPVEQRFADPDGEVNLGLSMEQAIAEAKRCMSCGLCFTCDSCWKYCQDQAIVKPMDRNEPYKFKLEFCQGCKKCAEECPCGYIEMR
ncbi:MAG: NAD(P)-binding protein [Acidobacteriota bacterium]